MPSLINEDTNETITRYVSLNESQEVIRVVHQALDGEQYIQRIGEPTIRYALTLYVNEAGKQLLMAVEDTGALLAVSINRGTFRGRIIEISNYEKLPAGYYKTTITLSKETEE